MPSAQARSTRASADASCAPVRQDGGAGSGISVDRHAKVKGTAAGDNAIDLSELLVGCGKVDLMTLYIAEQACRWASVMRAMRLSRMPSRRGRRWDQFTAAWYSALDKAVMGKLSRLLHANARVTQHLDSSPGPEGPVFSLGKVSLCAARMLYPDPLPGTWRGDRSHAGGSSTGSQRPQVLGNVQHRRAAKGPGHGNAGRYLAT